MRSEIEAMQDGVVTFDEAGLARLHGEVMMLSRLVGDLRTLSLAEGGGLSLHLEPTPLAPFLQRILSSFAPRAAESGVKLTLLDVPEGLAARLDPERMAQVLGNLLDNALRHAGPGAVEVGAEPADKGEGKVRLWLRDHGPGLPEDGLERVFERFYRGDAARTRGSRRADDSSGSGSGLGLAIARALVEAHGGRLEAANHPAGGAVFVLTLPGVPKGESIKLD